MKEDAPKQPTDISLTTLNFDNAFVRELPADPDRSNRVRQVHRACYSRVQPTPVAAPQLVAYTAEVAELLDLQPASCAGEEFAQVFVGNHLLPGMDPYACCYGGHQFGNWAGQLGDGRAINLGEILNQRGQRWRCSSKVQGSHPIPAVATAWRCCVPRCANFSVAKRCTTSAYQPPAP
jgi:hypothetical protein